MQVLCAQMWQNMGQKHDLSPSGYRIMLNLKKAWLLNTFSRLCSVAPIWIPTDPAFACACVRVHRSVTLCRFKIPPVRLLRNRNRFGWTWRLTVLRCAQMRRAQWFKRSSAAGQRGMNELNKMHTRGCAITSKPLPRQVGARKTTWKSTGQPLTYCSCGLVACSPDPTLTAASVPSILAIRAICLFFHSAWLPLRGLLRGAAKLAGKPDPCVSDVHPIVSINILNTRVQCLSVARRLLLWQQRYAV